MSKGKKKRGQRGKGKGLVADTMQQAAAWLGVSVEILTWSRSNGCPAFRHGRIHCVEIKPWLEDNPPKEDGEKLPSTVEMQILCLREDLKKKRHENEERDGDYVKRSDVKSQVTAIFYKQKMILLQALRCELPPKLEGLRAAEMVPQMEEIGTKVLNLWHDIQLPQEDVREIYYMLSNVTQNTNVANEELPNE